MRHVTVVLTIFALLAGCATNPDGSYNDRNCRIPDDVQPGNSGNPLVDLAAMLLVEITWLGGCEAVVGIANGIHNFHGAHTHEGVYYSPDGTFSVAVPGGSDSGRYQVQQQVATDKDTVVFVPKDVNEPAYGITALRHLQEADAALSLEAFADKASTGLPTGQAGGGFTRIHAEDVQLGANPARFVVYSSASAPETYYLMYFVKTAHVAAILSITWPKRCPECANASESSLRQMDPDLESFVTSFELTNDGD